MGKRKISNTTASIMIGAAVICDLINIAVDFATLGIGGFIIDALTALFFSIWFWHLGVSLGSSRNAGRTILAILLDAFPVTDLTFPWTWQVAYTAFTERYPVEHEQEQQKKPASNRLWRV